MPSQTPASRAWNAGARFLPPAGQLARPAIAVAGCMVLTWIRDGRLHVAIDLDDADPRLCAGPDGTVPVSVTIQGTEIFTAP